ncbi:MAG: hypothetical protein HHAS10_03970 [Candidatus Altimarinota bacterium]
MYSNEQSRINAIISYFFLGPFILFAKKDTPLGDSYVQSHARESSKIIGIMILLCVFYFFVRKYISIGIPGIGINVATLVLASIIGITLFYLSRGAYHAYLGNMPGEKTNININQLGNIEVSGIYKIESEEEKSRILASMIPLLGIWIAKKYQLPIMIRGRVLGSLFAFLYFISFLISSEVGFLPNLILISGIVVFVVEAIYIFLYGSFVSWNIVDKILTYNEIEAHIKASVKSIFEFFRVSLGKEKSGSYKEYYSGYLAEAESIIPHEEKYFMPASLIGLPFWNLFTIPSLFIKKFQSYRRISTEGLIITLIFSFFFFWRKEFSSPYLLLLLFPIVHILVYARESTNIHTPGIGLITGFFHFVKSTHTTIQEAAIKNSETFTYSSKEKEEPEKGVEQK